MSDEPVPAPTTPVKRKKKTKERESWLETVKTVVYALLIALVIRTFLFQPFYIPSGSMESTLMVGDYLFIEKFAYGYSRYSWPFGGWPIGGMLGHGGRFFESMPDRGDVVVFKYPGDNSTDYIKRVIGLPGDRVQLIDGRVYINDKPVTRVAAGTVEVDCPPFDVKMRVPQFQETLSNGKSFFTADCTKFAPRDNTEVYTVPPDSYFMMGDNRDNSEDSRFWGYVPAENLVGKAEFRFFSYNENFIWYEPWTWPGGIRYDRMFSLVH